MTITPERSARTLSDLIAEEVRVLLTRRRLSQRQFAAQLGVSPAWLNYRLTGVQEIGVNDLNRIAKALGVGVYDLLPSAEEAAQAVIRPQAIPRYLDLPVRFDTHTDRPIDNRPAGRPATAATTGVTRTAYVTRRRRGRRD